MSGRAALLTQPSLPVPLLTVTLCSSVPPVPVAGGGDGCTATAPLAVPSLPHTHHCWPCHLVLAQCPDRPGHRASHTRGCQGVMR